MHHSFSCIHHPLGSRTWYQCPSSPIVPVLCQQMQFLVPFDSLTPVCLVPPWFLLTETIPAASLWGFPNSIPYSFHLSHKLPDCNVSSTHARACTHSPHVCCGLSLKGLEHLFPTRCCCIRRPCNLEEVEPGWDRLWGVTAWPYFPPCSLLADLVNTLDTLL